MIERWDITPGPVRMTRQKFLQNQDRQINVAGEIRAIRNEKNGASDQIRTDDPFITNELLYQLSYAGSGLRPEPKGAVT